MTSYKRKDDYNSRFGERLFLIRSFVNIKQDSFADLLEVNFTRYQAIESGYITTDFAVFIWIVDHIHVYFGVDVMDLIASQVDESEIEKTVRAAWTYFQSHSDEVKNNLIPPDMYQIITEEQKQHIRNEKRLKVRKDAKKVFDKEKEESRILINVILGERVKFVRQAINENQVDLATTLCITDDRLSTLEKGETVRNFSIIIRLLLIFQRLDVTLYDLIGENFNRSEVKQRVLEARARNRSQYVIKDTTEVIKIG